MVSQMEEIAERKATVGDHVRQLRQARGWSQERLAVEAGLYSRTVRRIEQGEDFTFGSLTAIADALDTTAAEILAEAS
jgi:transcriptional regulator with XRE-family HTH domain